MNSFFILQWNCVFASKKKHKLIYSLVKVNYDKRGLSSTLIPSYLNALHHSLYFQPIFIRPSKTGRIMGSPMAGGRAASTSLSGAYLQNYSSYGYEISWVDRSHQGGVQCAGIITLASLIFQLLPFGFFHT